MPRHLTGLFTLVALLALGRQGCATELVDGTWITLDGTVVAVEDGAFRLDHGGGLITVELDDWDDFDEATLVRLGDPVRVIGRIDDDFREGSRIEAAAVLLAERGVLIRASADDEEDRSHLDLRPVAPGEVMVEGTITAVDRPRHTVTLDSGHRQLTVAVGELGYDPLDEVGRPRLVPGVRISVRGRLRGDPLEGGRELVAEALMTLERDAGRSAALAGRR